MVASASKLAAVIGYDFETGHDAAREADPTAVRPLGGEVAPNDVSVKRRSP
jgi:hypothetical protein